MAYPTHREAEPKIAGVDERRIKKGAKFDKNSGRVKKIGYLANRTCCGFELDRREVNAAQGVSGR